MVENPPPDATHYIICTPAEKSCALADSMLGVGTITILQWVTSTLDEGDPVISKTVAMVLGPLLATPQLGHNIGYDLEMLCLSYTSLALPLISFGLHLPLSLPHVLQNMYHEFQSTPQCMHQLLLCVSI